MNSNAPDKGPYSEMYRLAAVEFEEAKAAVERAENELDITLAVILDADDGAKTTAKERAKNNPRYRQKRNDLTEARLAMRLKQVELKTAEMAFDEWRTREASKRAEMRL